MNPVRLLALDLDDTLLRSDLTISYRTRNAIKRAESAGVTVVLASGRIPAAMEQFAKLLGMHRRPGFLICNNGTIIQESHTGNITHEVRLEAGNALIAFDLADAEGFPVQIYEDDIMYVSRRNEFTEYDQKLTGLRQVVVENFRAMVRGGCHKLLIPGDPALLNPLEKLVRAYLGDDITLFTSKPYFLEILPSRTDKGSALAKIAGFLGVKREETLAIGDSMNDEAMLRWAGTGVAMANGDERIKNIAALVTERTNDDDGVAEIIENYVLAKKGAPHNG
ncbi:MAG: Cof-type HAD-IIB family hydrolase [Treponema sp.]|jgi:Cof subfamily protein (haloacid dehalogenase superfamily)|nr:Cof-type HAD-IIB family hydrolase [Treponema sp.]